MTLTVIVDIADASWLCAVPDMDTLATTAARNAIARAEPRYAADQTDVEIGLTFADDEFVRTLNKQYRGKDKPTNVLSFPLDMHPPLPGVEGNYPILLGDVVLALQTVIREAVEAKKPLAAHMQHLVVHGVLHLLGYDHEEETQAKAMESLEIEILDAMDIANPYTVQSDAD